MCRCDCGNTVVVDTRFLNRGHTKSCGCLQRDRAKENAVDMTGFENEGVIVLSRYGSDSQQVALWNCQCKYCGSIFVSRGSAIRNGAASSCGCVHSKNERNISKILIDNGIDFKREYTFPDLVGMGGKRLRFDFAIMRNGKLDHLIEFNGSQHYEKPSGSWGSEYDTLIVHDKMKKDYCEKKGIRLITLKFDDDYCINDLI